MRKKFDEKPEGLTKKEELEFEALKKRYYEEEHFSNKSHERFGELLAKLSPYEARLRRFEIEENGDCPNYVKAIKWAKEHGYFLKEDISYNGYIYFAKYVCDGGARIELQVYDGIKNKSEPNFHIFDRDANFGDKIMDKTTWGYSSYRSQADWGANNLDELFALALKKEKELEKECGVMAFGGEAGVIGQGAVDFYLKNIEKGEDRFWELFEQEFKSQKAFTLNTGGGITVGIIPVDEKTIIGVGLDNVYKYTASKNMSPADIFNDDDAIEGAVVLYEAFGKGGATDEKYDEWKKSLINIIKKEAQLDDSEIALRDSTLKEYYDRGLTPEKLFFEEWEQDAGNYYAIPFGKGGRASKGKAIVVTGENINEFYPYQSTLRKLSIGDTLYVVKENVPYVRKNSTFAIVTDWLPSDNSLRMIARADAPEGKEYGWKAGAETVKGVLDEKKDSTYFNRWSVDQKIINKKMEFGGTISKFKNNMKNFWNSFANDGAIITGGSYHAGSDSFGAGGAAGIKYPTERLKVAEQSEGERQLELFIDNDGDLYRQRVVPIQTNLVTKIAQGKFDINLAPKIYLYLIEDGQKKFMKASEDYKDAGLPLTKAQKENLAKEYVNRFLQEASYGNYENYLPKKYRMGKGGAAKEESKVDFWISMFKPRDDDWRESTLARLMEGKSSPFQTSQEWSDKIDALEYLIENKIPQEGEEMARGGKAGKKKSAPKKKAEPKKDLDWNEQALIELREHEGDDSIEQVRGVDNDGFEMEGGGRSYLVFKNEDDARDFAIARVKDDLESQPELFSPDWLINQMDATKAEEFFKEIYDEHSESYAKDILSESYDGDYANRLAEEMYERKIISEEDAKNEDFDFESKIPDFVENYTQEALDEGNNGYDYYKFNFGDDEAKKIVLDNNLIDIDEASESAVSEDGIGHFLSGWDGDQIDLPSGAVAYKN